MTFSTRNSVAVLKLGGSLLDWAGWPNRLAQVCDRLVNDRPLVICGGGEAADVVRQWHRDHALSEERSHWLALEAIRLNQQLVLELFPSCELVATREQAESAWARQRVALLDLVTLLHAEEALRPVSEHLPHTWDVTSDSLAAWVTAIWPAQRLILLKSVSKPELAWSEAASSGLVDRYFPTLSPKIPRIDWLNLRYTAAADELPHETCDQRGSYERPA